VNNELDCFKGGIYFQPNNIEPGQTESFSCPVSFGPMGVCPARAIVSKDLEGGITTKVENTEGCLMQISGKADKSVSTDTSITPLK